MKKTLVTIALGISALTGFSQGTIVFQNISATYAITTNTAAFGSGLSGVSGSVSSSTPFYYALLYKTYTGSLTTNYAGTSAGWTFAEYGTNVSTGGIKAPGGSTGAAITGLTAPSGSTYDTAGEYYYLIAGWSASLGTTWTAVQSQLNTLNWSANGFFGVSQLAYGYSGGGPNTLLAPSVFGVSTGMPGGLAGGFNLYSVAAVPEPGTLALAALGGASLLLFRRRK